MSYKIETLVEKQENREDSFWYYGTEIARAVFPNGKKLYAESRGAIGVQLTKDGIFLKGQNAVDEAIELGFTDTDLDLINEYDGWDMNNWFAIVEVDINGNVISDDFALGGDYDEAIELLKQVAEEKAKEYYNK
jgi:hypothetical protein